MHPNAATTPPTAPNRSESGATFSLSIRVPTASTHQLLSPVIINWPYATAPTKPIRLPATARTTPSRRNTFRTRDAGKPIACRVPISRRRCSTPSLKNSAVKSSAEITRKKLK